MDGLKSKVVDAPSVMVGDHLWRKVVLDFHELMTALKRDTVSELVGDVLRNEYGKWGIFPFLVLEVKKAVMASVSDALEKGLPRKNDLVVVFRHDLLEKIEVVSKHTREPMNASYWIGENYPIT